MEIIYLVLEILFIISVITIPILIKVFRTRCTKCREKYTPQNMVISSSELKWVEKEKKEEGRTGGILSVTGTKYVRFINYKVYYRIVTFTFKCEKCGRIRSWHKKYKLYDGSSGRSQSTEQEIALLRKKIRKTLGKKFLNGTAINIKNIDY